MRLAIVASLLLLVASGVAAQLQLPATEPARTAGDILREERELEIKEQELELERQRLLFEQQAFEQQLLQQQLQQQKAAEHDQVLVCLERCNMGLQLCSQMFADDSEKLAACFTNVSNSICLCASNDIQ